VQRGNYLTLARCAPNDFRPSANEYSQLANGSSAGGLADCLMEMRRLSKVPIRNVPCVATLPARVHCPTGCC